MSGFTPFNYTQTAGVVPPGSISNAELANMAARTVKVNATNSSASPQDLQGTTPLNYLRVNAAGTGLEWGALPVDPGLVTSVFTRTGAVVATNGDYTASQVTNVPAGNIAAVTVQAAIAELDAEKAGLALANVFTQPQTINAGSGATPGATGLTVRSDDAGVNGPFLATYHNSASPAANDILAGILAYGRNSTPTDFLYAHINFLLTSPTAGAESSAIQWYTTVAGTRAVRATVASGLAMAGATSGDQGAGTINATNLFVNGVNLTSTYGRLGVGNIWTAANQFTAARTAFIANNEEFAFYVQYGAGTGQFYHGATNSATPDYVFRQTGGAERFRIANSGDLSASGNVFVDINGLLRPRAYTVGTLPAAAGVAGALARVSDALAAPVYNAAAVGGGTTNAQVMSDGTIWRYC